MSTPSWVRIHVDMLRCTGQARCYFEAPELYELDDQGNCSVPVEVVGPEHYDAARLGRDSCPERAITIEGLTGPPGAEVER